MSKKKVFKKDSSNNILNSVAQSMKDHNENSLDSTTGYMDHGNDSIYQAKGRVMRNNDNGSHF